MAKKQPKITVIERDISDLIFAEYNPRQMTADQKQHLTDSMKRFGFVDPIIINTHEKRSNVIIGGHQRVRIAKELGITSIPCVELSLDINEEKELNIRLNKNTGEWDFDALANYFEVSDLIEWGFDEKELNFDVEAQEGLTDDDAIPEVTEPTCKPGDLWILGDHRLLCGDATISTDVDRLMNGEKAQTFFTDPPYGDNVGGLEPKKASERVKGKGLVKRVSFIENDLKIDWLEDVFTLVPQFLEEKNTKMVFFKWDKLEQIKKMAACFGEPTALCVWDRVRMASAFFRFQPQHELCFHWGNQADKKDKSSLSNVWRVPKELELKELHPTVKPIAIIEPALSVTTDSGKIVVDLFLGSGSTLIACEKTNRKCYGMELDPKYCDVIIKRWEDYTGKKAELYAVTEG